MSGCIFSDRRDGAQLHRFRDLGGMHFEVKRFDGQFSFQGSPFFQFVDDAQIAAVMQGMKEDGAMVANNHTMLVKEGGMKSVDDADAAFKRRMDPYDLMNPGKMSFNEKKDSGAALPSEGWKYKGVKASCNSDLRVPAPPDADERPGGGALICIHASWRTGDCPMNRSRITRRRALASWPAALPPPSAFRSARAAGARQGQPPDRLACPGRAGRLLPGASRPASTRSTASTWRSSRAARNSNSNAIFLAGRADFIDIQQLLDA